MYLPKTAETAVVEGMEAVQELSGTAREGACESC
jgi:hypothetical protein